MVYGSVAAVVSVVMLGIGCMLYAEGDEKQAQEERAKLVVEYHQTVATMPRYARDALWLLGYLADYSEKLADNEKEKVETTAKEYFFFVLGTGEMQRLIAGGKSDDKTLAELRRHTTNIKERVSKVRACFSEFGVKLELEHLGDDILVPPCIARVAGSAVDEYRKGDGK